MYHPQAEDIVKWPSISKPSATIYKKQESRSNRANSGNRGPTEKIKGRERGEGVKHHNADYRQARARETRSISYNIMTSSSFTVVVVAGRVVVVVGRGVVMKGDSVGLAVIAIIVSPVDVAVAMVTVAAKPRRTMHNCADSPSDAVCQQ